MYLFDTEQGVGKGVLQATIALDANNATKAHDVFEVSGIVKIKRLRGVLKTKTTLTNMTDCHFNLNDGTIDVPITLDNGLTMSTVAVGSIVDRINVATSVANFVNVATCAVNDSQWADFWQSEFVVAQKASTTTNIQWVYTTTDAPIDATMDFYVEFEGINGGYLSVA